MAKTYFAVLAIGRDTPGVVATITGILSRDFSCNIETSHMASLGGHFATNLIASSEGGVDPVALESALAQSTVDSSVRSVYVHQIDASEFQRADGDPSLSITFEASERAGVLHEVSDLFAKHDVNIAYLASMCAHERESLCHVAVDVILPEGMDKSGLRDILASSLPEGVDFEFAPMPGRP